MNEPTILHAIKTLMGNSPEHLNALIISGAGGAYARAVFAPQSS